jgi:predicted unusual protein kinase regulating ubiquinone biosynthesis (AarF/ABC1/UbiB family)
MAWMSSKVTTGYVTDAALSAVSSPERSEARRAERQLRTTAEVVETLGSMKGAFMKLGQMASYLDAGLDPEVRKQLAALQANAPPMSSELAASVIAAELGKGPEQVFASWDPEPLAAASIGQVHRAVTRDGRAVAVKVQYPGVDEAIRADLDNSTLLMQLVRVAFPALDAGTVVAELRSRIGEELDYGLEARNQAVFAEHFAGHPFIHVPSVIRPLSTRRVLTTELVSGTRYEQVVDTWSQEERDLAGETIFRFVFGCLYRFKVFNGDPHPGNYLFHGDGRVSFLDFGLVKWFSASDVSTLSDMIRSMVIDPDRAAFRRTVEAAGFLRTGADLTDEQVADYFRHYYELVLARGPSSFSPEYASETLRHFFDAGDPVIKQANVPAPFVILQRINLGLYAVLAGLGSVADWRAVAEEIWPFMSASPSTRLGKAEAAWRAKLG